MSLDSKEFESSAEELSSEQLHQLECAVKDFLENVQDSGIEQLTTILPMMGHGSHANNAATPGTSEDSPQLAPQPTSSEPS